MRKNNILLLIIIVLLLPFSSIFSQETSTQTKFKIKTGFSIISVVPDYYKPFLENEGNKVNRPNFTLELSYSLLRNIDLGIDLGYSQLLNPYKNEGMISYGYEKTNAFFYGINTSIHILPMILKRDDCTFDVYVIAKAGNVNQSWRVFESGEIQSSNHLEYGLGLGVAYYFTKTFSLFGEYYVGNFINDDFSKIKAGISFRF